MKKFEYAGKQWHEQCFCCHECKQPICDKSFIPRDQYVICVTCYEQQYAQHCSKCNGVSTSCSMCVFPLVTWIMRLITRVVSAILNWWGHDCGCCSAFTYWIIVGLGVMDTYVDPSIDPARIKSDGQPSLGNKSDRFSPYSQKRNQYWWRLFWLFKEF
jgi:LIM domain